MFNTTLNWPIMICAALVALATQVALAETEDLGNGFRHHGVATPVSKHRGIVATVDGDGRDVALVWLFDHRGGYALLMIDAETGEAEQFPMPFPSGGDCPFASILSSRNKFYTHFGSNFCEFDPVARKFTFFHETAKRMAMGMTEDDDGVIWSVTYPNSGVVSYDPGSGEFTDYGHVYAQNWAQYQRYVATDDMGWLYFGIGSTASQIIAFNPETGEANPMIPEDERVKGAGYVYRNMNGRVYGYARAGKDSWYEFYRGEKTKLDEHTKADTKPIITSSQGLFYRDFPSGRRLSSCDLVERVMTVDDPATGETKRLEFDYTSEGAHLMGLATAPDNTICGGTAFPMRFFSYDPVADEWTNRAAYGQWNTVVRQGDRFFVGGYGGGFLLEWDPAQEWVPTVKGREGCNPVFHTQCTPTIHRPHDLLAHPDGKTIVLAGTPGYGYTGGGLLFWDRETETETLVPHTEILPQHSTRSLVALPDGKLLGGSTIGAGTGGEVKASLAELYIMDMETKAIDWHEPLFPDISSYYDLLMGPDGLVFGFAGRDLFFVFDPATREVVHQQDTTEEFGKTNGQQGPRVFVVAPDGAIYILFVKGVARLDPASYEIEMLAESPVPIAAGGDILDGRIYFSSGSHVYSYEVPTD